MQIIEYDRSNAVGYAKKWALSRNPEFYDYADIGGDCTSFVSQCIYAGCGVMNYTPTFGWYYIDANDKSPSWAGVEFFYNFMVGNTGVGPFAEPAPLSRLIPGDVIQLGTETGRFYHTLILTAVRTTDDEQKYYISAHNYDAYQRDLDTYNYSMLRGLHIIGARTN